VLQGKTTNYETDLLRPIIEHAGELLRKTYGDDARTDTVLRINADHARATAFLINDGIVPSNEGRGYVLRKIMRRAMRNARMIGGGDPYLYKLTGFVAEHMRDAYPEMMESVQRVARVVKDEEHRYATTFQVAEKFFHDEAKTALGGLIPGAAAFKLYDTYGLALDEQEDMARDAGLAIDREGFEAEMEKQRTRARASWKGAEKAQVNPVYQVLPKTEFVGREALESPATVTAVISSGNSSDNGGEIALDRTPFYAEAGGQIGDTGLLVSPETGATIAVVESTYSAAPGKSVHRVKLLGPVKTGDTVVARVDPASRHATMRNHTGTHLLHAALRTVLGTHVKQAGSVVEPSRLRFDFSHYTAMDPEEIAEVERLMNEQILANRAVVTNIMDLDRALQTGAMALFGEKYGDEVRVVQIDSFSKELCGGTHVERTGDIGICKIVYEGSISAGVRRIEAITGAGALKKFQEFQTELARNAGIDVEKLKARERQLESELQQLKTKMAQAEAGKIEPDIVKGVKVLYRRIDGVDKAQLRVMADDLRNRFGEGVVVLGTSTGEVVAGVTKTLTTKVPADKLIRSAGAKGGGRPDMAEGRVQDLETFLKTVAQKVEESL
jgi:alanyl-tRNA synthetase